MFISLIISEVAHLKKSRWEYPHFFFWELLFTPLAHGLKHSCASQSPGGLIATHMLGGCQAL